MLEALETWRPGQGDTAWMRNRSDGAKTALGRPAPANEAEGRALIEKAIAEKRRGHLAEAADLMEEAFNKSEGLRDKYAAQVKLWLW